MTTNIEKVARAICFQNHVWEKQLFQDENWHNYIPHAKAAIDASAEEKKVQYTYFISYNSTNNGFGSVVVDLNEPITTSEQIKNLNDELRNDGDNLAVVLNYILLNTEEV